MSSAICSSLDQFEMLSFDNGLSLLFPQHNFNLFDLDLHPRLSEELYLMILVIWGFQRVTLNAVRLHRLNESLAEP